MKILFLTVAGNQGNGHLIRSIAISSYLQKKGHKCFFVIDRETKLLKKKIS